MTNVQVSLISDHQESALFWIHGLNQRAISAKAVKLERNSYKTFACADSDLLILDINGDHSQVPMLCRYARALLTGPLLLFSYESDERFHLAAYEAGVDESISKPVGMPLFLAKVAAWLRRTSARAARPPSLSFEFDSARRALTTPEGQTVRLSKLEARLAHYLMSNQGRVLEPEVIMAYVWAECEYGESDRLLLKNLIYRLRKKIEPVPEQPRYVHTVLGQGYRFGATNV